jgi:hypothetical protein
VSINGRRLNEPMRDYSDDPRMPIARNPRQFDLDAIRSQRVVRPTSDRQRVEQLRADPVARFDDVAPVRKLPRGVVP